jgi:uncharacterized membrane protein
MSGKECGLLIACVWAIATLVLMETTDAGILRLAAAAPLVLYFPGHGVLSALRFRARSVQEWGVLAAGVSIGLAIVGGFVLDALHVLLPLGWWVWCAGFVLVMSAIAFARGQSHEEPAKPGAMRFRLRHGVVLGVAAVLVGGAFVITARDDATYRQFRYTNFWMLPGKDHPSQEVTLGVTSAEAEPRTFDIEVTLSGNIVAAFRSIQLAPGETVTRQVLFPLEPGQLEKAEAWLINGKNRSQVYRRVSLWVGDKS